MRNNQKSSTLDKLKMFEYYKGNACQCSSSIKAWDFWPNDLWFNCSCHKSEFFPIKMVIRDFINIMTTFLFFPFYPLIGSNANHVLIAT